MLHKHEAHQGRVTDHKSNLESVVKGTDAGMLYTFSNFFFPSDHLD